jgi:hypothetical protein
LAALPTLGRTAARGPFVILLAVVLGLGLLMLLGLNTTLAQGSFEAYDLRRETVALAEQEQELLQQVAAAESPESLEAAARRLGMVPAENPVFLRLSDGKVLGVPVAAKAPPAPAPPKKATPASSAATEPAEQKPAEQKSATKPADKKKAAASKPTAKPTTRTDQD